MEIQWETLTFGKLLGKSHCWYNLPSALRGPQCQSLQDLRFTVQRKYGTACGSSGVSKSTSQGKGVHGAGLRSHRKAVSELQEYCNCRLLFRLCASSIELYKPFSLWGRINMTRECHRALSKLLVVTFHQVKSALPNLMEANSKLKDLMIILLPMLYSTMLRIKILS